MEVLVLVIIVALLVGGITSSSSSSSKGSHPRGPKCPEGGKCNDEWGGRSHHSEGWVVTCSKCGEEW